MDNTRGNSGPGGIAFNNSGQIGKTDSSRSGQMAHTHMTNAPKGSGTSNSKVRTFVNQMLGKKPKDNSPAQAGHQLPVQHANASNRAVTLSDETIQAIAGSVKQRLEAWNASASAHLAQNTNPLRVDHVLMATLLDALYKHHFKSSFGAEAIDSIPSDESLQRLCQEAFKDVHPSARAVADKIMASFQPHARETMQLLYRDFENLPGLKDIQPRHRWRLLVDRLKIDMLKQHGIDVANPFLGFLFDSDRGYGNSVAKGWKCVGECLVKNCELSADLILTINAISGGKGFVQHVAHFGAFYSKDGMKALADWMSTLAEKFKVMTWVRIGDTLIVSKEEGRFTGRVSPGKFDGAAIGQALSEATSTEQSLMELMEANAAANTGTSPVMFYRNDTPEKIQHDILKTIVGRYDDAFKNASTPEQQLQAAAAMFFEGDHSHLLKDGNYRLFGKYMLNFLLGKQGQGFTELYDTDRNEGMSPAELVGAVQEGQEWFASLR